MKNAEDHPVFYLTALAFFLFLLNTFLVLLVAVGQK